MLVIVFKNQFPPLAMLKVWKWLAKQIAFGN